MFMKGKQMLSPIYDFDDDRAQHPTKILYSKKADNRCCENCLHKGCKHPEYTEYDFCDDWEKKQKEKL